MDTIRTSAAASNTVVFFTSDNGSPVHPDGNTPLRGYKGSTWEGGYREPGIAWWPGKIEAGGSSDAIVASYDLFPTVLALAGVPPPGVTLDGIDISPVLFGQSDQGHECVMFYKFPHAATTSTDPNNLVGVRCNATKVFWFTDGGGPAGTSAGVQAQPLVFDLVADPTETTPLTPGSPEYERAVSAADVARRAHIATLQIVPDQNARGNDRNLAICGAPNSTAQYPQWPNCSLTPQFWTIPICGSPNSHWCNQTANGSCPADCPSSNPHPPPPRPPSVPVPTTNLVGCFHDHQSNGECDLPTIIQGHCKGEPKATIPYPLTTELCNSLCYARNSSFKYFGTQYGFGCFCGDTYGRFGAASPSACNSTCPGNKQEICGGANLNSVWKIQPVQ
mmetsp:Transcript_292/g.945  ORF Transcript_292/g.945 Transcript_292/m.945 type:complete len:391 (+) Transcript_292:287-1459(+)